MTDLPSLTILGVPLRCYLDADGKRVYNQDDVLALMERWGDGAVVSEEDRRAFAEWKLSR